MSILKYFNGRNRSLSKLKDRIIYISDPDKVKSGYVGGTGILPTTAFQDMKTIKILHGKVIGRQYIHMVLSFDTEVTPLLANEVCTEILEMYRGRYQVIFAIHENTENVHGHFIINSVGVEGEKFRQSKSEMLQFRAKINLILKKYGLNEIRKTEIGDEDENEFEVLYQEAQWDMWEEDDYSDYIDECAEDDFVLSENHESFVGTREKTGNISVPIWFGEQKPFVPIWFEERELIKFYEKKEQCKKQLIYFCDQEGDEDDLENIF